MRKFGFLAVAAMFAVATAAPVPFAGMDSTALAAKAKKKKDVPGKCGTMRYYDKKKKACVSKG